MKKERSLTEPAVRLSPKLRRLLIEAVGRPDGRILVSMDRGHPNTRQALVHHGWGQVRLTGPIESSTRAMFITDKGRAAVACTARDVQRALLNAFGKDRVIAVDAKYQHAGGGQNERIETPCASCPASCDQDVVACQNLLHEQLSRVQENSTTLDGKVVKELGSARRTPRKVPTALETDRGRIQ